MRTGAVQSRNAGLPVEAPQIVLTWLARLRWLAAGGQVAAIVAAAAMLGLKLPVVAMGMVVGVTLLTNALLVGWLGRVGRMGDGPSPLPSPTSGRGGLGPSPARSAPHCALRSPGEVGEGEGAPALPDAGGAPVPRLGDTGEAPVVQGAVPRWIVPGVLLLDIGLLTALLYCSGGPENPFSTLYLVHVAMAVVAAPRWWNWVIVAAAVGSYALLFAWHEPLSREPLPVRAVHAGNWTALALVAALIAYFTGRVTRALRRRERELAAAREQVARGEQLAALATLAAGAAHELNTPLGTIAVAARELERASGACDPSIGEDARLIRQEVDRCRAIIDRMRVEVAGDGLHRRDAVTVEELLSAVSEGLSEAERGRLDLRASVAGELAIAVQPVQQAVTVLLRNAFDASAGESRVELSIEVRGGEVEFVVADQGAGMAEDVLRRAGEPFFTTKPPGKGMGLGLFLVRLVAERCGGSFMLDSRPERGTRAVLSIPVGVRGDERGDSKGALTESTA